MLLVGFKNAVAGARTQDHKVARSLDIKSLALYRLSYDGRC